MGDLPSADLDEGGLYSHGMGFDDDAPRTTPRDGATDGPETLRLRLPSAPPPYLTAAADNPLLGPEEMLLLLRNRQAPGELLRRIAGEVRWTALREVRGLLAQHPRSPIAVARRFLPHLAWVELADAARDIRVSPAVRRDAERLLTVRLPELAVGERIALARRASRRVIAALRSDTEVGVLRALLENPLLTEADAVWLAGSPTTPGQVLDRISRHARFGLRPAVRRGILRNAAAPVPTALRLVACSPRADLPALARDEAAPTLVRVAARRRLSGTSPSPEGSDPGADRSLG